jgi:hypothetical protein
MKGENMGAEQISQIITGKTPQEAWREAVDQARWEHGNGGYTGTLAEVPGFFIQPTSRPMGEYDADHLGDQLVGNGKVRKWEDAALIPISDPGRERMVTLEVDVTDVTQGDWQWSHEAEKIYNTVRDKYPNRIVVSIRRAGSDNKTKVVNVTDTASEKVTGYLVTPDWGGPALHPTLTEARKAAKEFGNASITKITQRASGKPLEQYRSVVTKKVVTVEAVIAEPSKKKPTRWLVAALASS